MNWNRFVRLSLSLLLVCFTLSTAPVVGQVINPANDPTHDVSFIETMDIENWLPNQNVALHAGTVWTVPYVDTWFPDYYDFYAVLKVYEAEEAQTGLWDRKLPAVFEDSDTLLAVPNNLVPIYLTGELRINNAVPYNSFRTTDVDGYWVELECLFGSITVPGG